MLYYANFDIDFDMRKTLQIIATYHLTKSSIGGNFILFANKAYYLMSPAGKKLWLEGEKVFNIYLAAWIEMLADPSFRNRMSLQEFSLNAFKRTQSYSCVVDLVRELMSSFYKVAEDALRDALALFGEDKLNFASPSQYCFSIERNKKLVPLVSFGGAACIGCSSKGSLDSQQVAVKSFKSEEEKQHEAHSHLLQDQMEWVHPGALDKLQSMLEKELEKSSTGWQNVNSLAICMVEVLFRDQIDSSLLNLLPNRPKALQNTSCVGIRIIQPVPVFYKKMIESFSCLHITGAVVSTQQNSLDAFKARLKRQFMAAWKPDLVACCEAFYSVMSSHCGLLDSDSCEQVLPNFQQFLQSSLQELFDRWNQNVIERSKKLLKSTGAH